MLSSAHLIVPPLLLSALFFYVSQTIVNADAVLRARIIRIPLWKLQFFCAPVAMFVCLRAAARSSPTSWPWAAMALTPFCWNFAVEPWALPNDRLFRGAFYTHHVAPILACVQMQSQRFHSDGGMAQALLFAHCWLLHPIGNFDHWGIISKQILFWPYISSGFLCMVYWWSSSTTSMLAAAAVALQYAGRWGLFLRLIALYGAPMSADRFEVRKQPAELASFAVAFAVVSLGAKVIVPFIVVVLSCVLLSGG